MDSKKKKRGFLPFIKTSKSTTDPPSSPKPVDFVKFSNTTGKIEGLPPEIAKLVDEGAIDDPAALASAINAQKKSRLESEVLEKPNKVQSPPIPQKPGTDNKSPEIPQKPVIPQKPGVENKSPEIPQKPSIDYEYPPVEGEYIEKPKKIENQQKKETQKATLDFEYPPVEGEFIEKPTKRVKSTKEKSKSKSGENRRKSVSADQVNRVKKEKRTADLEHPPVAGELIPTKESTGEFIEKPKSDDSLQRKKVEQASPSPSSTPKAVPPAKPVAKKHVDYTTGSQNILQKSLPNIPIKPEKPPTIPSKLSTPQPSHVTAPPAVGNTPPPLLPPKPGTQKVIAKNYRPAAPGVCPEDIYRSLADLISKEDPRKRFINLVEIGQGSSGTVAVATDLQTNRQVAIKKMILNKGVNQVMVMKAEIMFMKMCKHKNIITYIDSYIVANVLWCVMEYMDAGDLTEVIRCSRKQLNEYQIATIIREILQGLAYLHNLPYPIIHRDLKSDNILLGLDGSVKITDFGFAAQLTPEVRTRTEVLGTCCWMAPEIVKGQEYGVKADIWSLGILAQELVDGEPPYYQDPPKQVFMSIATKGRGNFKNPDSLSAALKNFVKQCTIVDHNTRPSAAQLLRHPFLQQSANISTLIPAINQTISANTIKYEDY